MRLKKVKNADWIVASSHYVIPDPASWRGKWSTLFANDLPIAIEIGSGKGQFIIQMAIQNPHQNFIGIEMQNSVLLRAVQKLSSFEKPLPNLKLLSVDAVHITEIFAREIDVIYLNFSDPWPKKRHAKRRLTSRNFLEKYDLIFKNQKRVIQKTDNQDFFTFSLAELESHGYTLHNVSRDFHREDNVETEYEKKFRAAGVPICYVEAIGDVEED